MLSEKYRNTTLKSYNTRLRDGVEVPRDPEVFMAAIKRVLSSKLNNISKNFFLEQMLRTLPSKNKLMKMGKEDFTGFDGSNQCSVCEVLSDSCHQLAYCVFPHYALYALNNCSWWKSMYPNIELNYINLEFHTPIADKIDSAVQLQLDNLFLEIKAQGFHLWQSPNFHRLTATHLHILLIRSCKNIIELLKGLRRPAVQWELLVNLLDSLIQDDQVLTELYRNDFSHL